jgi:chromosomal replication initiation ATPase DnaA
MPVEGRVANQLTFDLALPPPTYAREDFVVAAGNREALAWLDRWPDWPAPALALGGPPGSGKTHLGRIWAARAQAALVEGADLEGKSVPDLAALSAASAAIVIEHADRAPDRALFHLYNLMRERRGHLLLISETPPARWRIALPDLASRLRAAPAVAVAPPDDELLGSIILKQLANCMPPQASCTIWCRTWSARVRPRAVLWRLSIAGRSPSGARSTEGSPPTS